MRYVVIFILGLFQFSWGQVSISKALESLFATTSGSVWINDDTCVEITALRNLGEMIEIAGIFHMQNKPPHSFTVLATTHPTRLSFPFFTTRFSIEELPWMVGVSMIKANVSTGKKFRNRSVTTYLPRIYVQQPTTSRRAPVHTLDLVNHRTFITHIVSMPQKITSPNIHTSR